MEETAAVVLDKVPESMWAPVSNWAFLSCCLAIAIVVMTAKRIIHQAYPLTYDKGKTSAIFTAAYLVIGLLAAIPKSYLHGETYFNRALIGVIASGVSLVLYHALLKRIAAIFGVKESDIEDPDAPHGIHESVVKEEPKHEELVGK
jgi:hypothetical protein